MAEKLTELEKTILLAFLALTKGSTSKYISGDTIVLKFPKFQRKSVRRHLDMLVEEKLLVKHGKVNFGLTEAGVKRATKVLSEGAMLWKF